MKANETKLAKLIEGTNQYLIPHFQRPYSWERREWDTLWEDLTALVEEYESERQHFMGSLVTAPAHSVPEGTTKYLLIDGQQRLTTLLIVLSAIRDSARRLGDERLANEVNDLYLTNRYQEGNDSFKLLPTQGDEPAQNGRECFFALLRGEAHGAHSRIDSAYSYFMRQLSESISEDLRRHKLCITGRLMLRSGPV